MGNIYRDRYEDLLGNMAPIHPETRFGDNVKLGNNVVIEKGCKIGSNVIIGHSVVMRPGTIIGDDCMIGHLTVFEGDCLVGKRTLIHAQCHVTKGASIGEDVFIAPFFCGANTPRIVHGRDYPLVLKPYRIERAVRIGVGVVVAPGVVIRENAQIGMGSVVTRDVPARHCWLGNPAAFHREVPTEELL